VGLALFGPEVVVLLSGLFHRLFHYWSPSWSFGGHGSLDDIVVFPLVSGTDSIILGNRSINLLVFGGKDEKYLLRGGSCRVVFSGTLLHVGFRMD
jgi:hypothetical protein